MISKYDHLLLGLAVSVIVAFVAYALLLQAQDLIATQMGRPFTFQERSVALLAICLNVLPMNYFRRRYHHKSLRGLVIGTMLLAGAWFFYFGRELLGA